MERAKTFFGNRDHEGYVGKEDHLVSFTAKMIKLLSFEQLTNFRIKTVTILTN